MHTARLPRPLRTGHRVRFQLACHGAAIAYFAGTAIGCGPAEILQPPGSKRARAACDPAEQSCDLVVGWIARLPELDYVEGSKRPTVEGWPAVGSTVAWTAVIRNRAALPQTDVPYRFYLDGAEVASGAVTVPAEGYARVEYLWTWTFDRHRLELWIDPDNVIAEAVEGNNSVEVFTDAISVGFYVEKAVHEYMDEHQHEIDPFLANSWEDWAQRQLRIWNRMLERAGAKDRIRLQKITIAENGALPLAGGRPTNNPNMSNRTVDLQWGFPEKDFANPGNPPFRDFYGNHKDRTMENPFYYEGSLFHELGHARYLVDVYGFDVDTDERGSGVAIREGGKLVAGSELMPFTSDSKDNVYRLARETLMSGHTSKIDEYDRGALDRIAGHRATFGNMNAPGNIGTYLQDLPAENELTVVDEAGTPLAGASVRIYRSGPVTCGTCRYVTYGKAYDDVPDMDLTADASGRVRLGRCPFDPDGKVKHGDGAGDGMSITNGVLIVRIHHGALLGYGFLPVTESNLQYWRGQRDVARWQARLKKDTTPPEAPTLIYPLDGDRTDEGTPRFYWDDLVDIGISYNLQLVDNDGDFSSPEVNRTGILANTFTAAALADGSYHWRVSGTDRAGNVGPWSTARSFTVDTVAPAAPALLSPADGANILDTTPTLDWADVSDPSGVTYRLQVDADAGFSSPATDVVGLADSELTLAAALPLGTFYWRVRSVDSAGNGSWSEARSCRLMEGLSLTAGWNVEAYLGPTKPADKAVASIADKLNVIWYFDNTTKKWSAYKPGAPPWANDLTTLVSGNVYWFQVSADVILEYGP